jgi:hypothetical protein
MFLMVDCDRNIVLARSNIAMTKRLRIFIGSSSEQMKIAESCKAIIESAHHKAIGWWEDEVFPVGQTLMVALRKMAKTVDGAIFIFSEDDKVWFRDKKLGQPRDNVLMEYGLFMGSTPDSSDARVVFCRVGKAKTASDVGGIIYITYDHSDQAAFIKRINGWLRRVSKITPSTRRDVEEYSEIFSSKTKEALFRAGETLVRSGAKHIILCAKTPVPVVGTRPYDESDEPEQYEIDQLNAYDEVLRRVSTDEKSRLTIVTCLGSVRQDLKEANSNSFYTRVRQRVGNLFKLASRSDGRLDLRWCDGTGITTFVAADAQSIIWFKKNNHENVWIAARGEAFVSAIRQQNVRLSRRIKMDEVLARLSSS